MLTTIALLAALAPAHAADANLPSRPTTYVVDDHLSEGPVENFRELYVNPGDLASKLSPVTPSTGKASLPIINESNSWAEITVNGTKIGVMGPLTNGAIHGLKAGSYTVHHKIQNGFESTHEVRTVQLEKPLVPGSKGAQKSLDEGWVPMWSADMTTGHVPELDVKVVAPKKRPAEKRATQADTVGPAEGDGAEKPRPADKRATQGDTVEPEKKRPADKRSTQGDTVKKNDGE